MPRGPFLLVVTFLIVELVVETVNVGFEKSHLSNIVPNWVDTVLDVFSFELALASPKVFRPVKPYRTVLNYCALSFTFLAKIVYLLQIKAEVWAIRQKMIK